MLVKRPILVDGGTVHIEARHLPQCFGRDFIAFLRRDYLGWGRMRSPRKPLIYLGKSPELFVRCCMTDLNVHVFTVSARSHPEFREFSHGFRVDLA